MIVIIMKRKTKYAHIFKVRFIKFSTQSTESGGHEIYPNKNKIYQKIL